MQALSKLLLPNETFQRFVHDSRCRLAATHLTTRTLIAQPFLGHLALTDQRLIFFDRNHHQAFPLHEIHSVHRKIQAVFFSTQTQKVQAWRPSGTIGLIRTFDFASALEQLLNTISAANQQPPSIPSQQVQGAVNCPRCGANVLVTPGQPGKCEYCNGFVQI